MALDKYIMFMLCSYLRIPLERRTLMNAIAHLERILSEIAAVTALFTAGYVLLMIA